VKEMIFLQDFQASGMIFHDASDLVCKCGIQATFNALFILLKSITFSPPCFFSPMIVDFFIFAGFPSQIKLKISFSISLIKCAGMTRTGKGKRW